jgi:hypothetical protein
MLEFLHLIIKNLDLLTNPWQVNFLLAAKNYFLEEKIGRFKWIKVVECRNIFLGFPWDSLGKPVNLPKSNKKGPSDISGGAFCTRNKPATMSRAFYLLAHQVDKSL